MNRNVVYIIVGVPAVAKVITLSIFDQSGLTASMSIAAQSGW